MGASKKNAVLQYTLYVLGSEMRPAPDSPSPPLPAFEPVRLRYRRDGWTPDRQRAFIAALACTRCVLSACRLVGISPEAAYKLYRRPDAASFRAAWDAVFALRPRVPPPVVPAAAADILPVRPGRGAPRPGPASPPAGTAPSAATSRQASISSTSSTSGRRWQLSESSASSTSGPSTSDAAAPRPAYSLEAFVRIARRSRIAPPAGRRAPR
jgi:hypothetical protein